jgi:hypothetical protein
MTVITDCKEFMKRVAYYSEQSLPEDERIAFENHRVECKKCRDALNSYAQVYNVLHGAFKENVVSPDFAAKTGQRFRGVVSRADRKNSTMPADFEPEDEQPAASSGMVLARLGAAPWWMVSASLHILIIALASLVSMSFALPASDDGVVMMTELQPRQALADQEKEKPKADSTDVLDKKETPATDLNSKEASDIVVPPDILAKAELGDHFETINPDRPDTQSAYGNPDSKSFHSVEGNVDAAGGGGMGGLGMDDLIGVGGAASKGTGGGWGGGDGTGVGVQSGAGKGSFGTRSGGGRKLMVKRHGGSKATEGAVDKALHWLAYHQEPDGHWDYVKFKGPSDLYEPTHFAALTGLATLAFLGAGHTSKVGEYKDNVQRALTWLKSQQDAQGCYSSVKGASQQHHIYDQGICTMAMAEAAAMTREKEWKESAQLGINFLHDFQNEYAGLRYVRKDGDSDTSIVGWYVMAMKSAKIAGLSVDHSGFEGAIAFLKTVSKTTGMGTDAMTEVLYRPDEAQSSGFEVDAHSTTAIGTLIQLFTGTKPTDDIVAGGGNYCLKKLPAWDKKHMYYWYYGTLTMFQIGGDQWKTWNEALKKTWVENQRKGGDEDGSWDCDGDYYGQGFGGRVYATAIGALCLEVYYRYLRLNQ